MSPVSVYVDGSIGLGNKSGIAAIARTNQGYFVGWLSRQLNPMTNNEAEYQATLLGLELATLLGLATLEIVSDSTTVVWQMQGRSRVNSARLKGLHQQTCQAVTRFQQVTFRCVSRTENQIADALATEALHGRCVTMPTDATNWSWLKKLRFR